MESISVRIKKEIISWPGVTSGPHKFGGVEFRYKQRELGHIHGDLLADLPFPLNTRNQLVDSGRVKPHHILPKSGWVSYWINNEKDDVSSVVDLFKLRYEQLVFSLQSSEK